LQGVSLSLVGWGRYHNDWGGQVLVIFMIAIAACEAAVAMALVLMLFRTSGKLDIADWQQLREAGTPEYIDPDELALPPVDGRRHWPELTPAGIEPQHDPEEEAYRSRV